MKQANLRVVGYQVSSAPPFLTIWLTYRGLPVGVARLSLEGRAAVLGDIVVQRRFPHWHPLLRALRIKTNYRGRGLGTALLARVISEARIAGVYELRGKMVGDNARLAAWYRRMGFDVNEATGDLSKFLWRTTQKVG